MRPPKAGVAGGELFLPVRQGIGVSTLEAHIALGILLASRDRQRFLVIVDGEDRFRLLGDERGPVAGAARDLEHPLALEKRRDVVAQPREIGLALRLVVDLFVLGGAPGVIAFHSSMLQRWRRWYSIPRIPVTIFRPTSAPSSPRPSCASPRTATSTSSTPRRTSWACRCSPRRFRARTSTPTAMPATSTSTSSKDAFQPIGRGSTGRAARRVSANRSSGARWKTAGRSMGASSR